MVRPIPIGSTVFDTAVGPCRIAWTERGVCLLRLPTPALQRERERRGAQDGALPPAMREVVARVQRHLDGTADDFADVPLDLDGTPPFDRRVYEAARRVPSGEVTTYGAVAKSIGAPDAARDVGSALGRNPITIVIPCHRVLAANGALGGFSAFGGAELKRALLAIEGVTIEPHPARRSGERRRVRLDENLSLFGEEPAR